MAGSLNVVQCLLLILHLAVKGHCARPNCQKNDIYFCVDMVKLQQLIQDVQKDFNTSHNERILLQAVTFDKIKKHKKYHGCVLLEIVDFYQQVLLKQVGDYTHLRGLLDEVKDCVPKHLNKTCTNLNEQAAEKKVNKAKIDQDMELLSKDITILQLQNLQAARHKVVETSEKATLDKAMDELQQLAEYITGKGLQKKRTRRTNLHRQ